MKESLKKILENKPFDFIDVQCSKIKVGRFMRPTFILALDNEGESNSEGEFCV